MQSTYGTSCALTIASVPHDVRLFDLWSGCVLEQRCTLLYVGSLEPPAGRRLLGAITDFAAQESSQLSHGNSTAAIDMLDGLSTLPVPEITRHGTPHVSSLGCSMVLWSPNWDRRRASERVRR